MTSIPAWFFGNATVSRMAGSSASTIMSRSIPGSDPSVRRRAHRERVEEEAEAEALLLLRDREEVEDLGLELRLVDPERAASKLDAVSDEVVGLGGRSAGI